MDGIPIAIGDYTVWIRKSIGSGSYGTVYRAKHRDGRLSAAKAIKSNI